MIPIAADGIIEHLSRTGGRYIEPFLGGGAMALWLGLPNMVLGDACRPLMETLHEIQKDAGAVVWNLSALAIRGVDKESYYRVRDMRPRTSMQRAARFLYLNRLCFNGIYRENSKGKFNVPYADARFRKSVIGRSARDAVESLFPNKERFHQVATALSGAQIGPWDFGELIGAADEGDLLYIDPPYDGAYSSYTALGFTVEDQERLAGELREAHEAGAAFIAHNADTDNVRKWYEWAPVIVRSKEKRQINADTRGRGRVPCLIITNVPELLTLEVPA